MFIGQTLATENYDDGGGVTARTATVYTDWFPRLGNAATFAFEVIFISDPDGSGDSTPTIKMTIQTKNLIDYDGGSGQSDVGNVTATDVGVGTKYGENLLELVRLKFEFYDDGGAPSERVMVTTFRALEPAWVTN
jgi:hypothetical protein